MDFSAEAKASGVKFCRAVHQHPRPEISQYGELCSPRNPKSATKAASAPPPAQRSQRLFFGSRTHDRAACGRRIDMCGYTSVPKDGHTCWVFMLITTTYCHNGKLHVPLCSVLLFPLTNNLYPYVTNDGFHKWISSTILLPVSETFCCLSHIISSSTLSIYLFF